MVVSLRSVFIWALILPGAAFAQPSPIVLTQAPNTPIVSASPVPASPSSEAAAAKQLTIELGSAAAALPLAGAPLAAVDAGVVFIDAMVNLGAAAWDVLQKGQPAANVSVTVANALPQGVSSALALEDWKAPVVREYCVSLNPNPNFDCDPGFIYAPSNFYFRVSFIPGGDLQGHGQYLTGVMIEPEVMNVAYNDSLSAQSNVESVVNVGTEEDPIAGMRIVFSWQLKEYNGGPFAQSLGFQITGDGRITPDAHSVITSPPPPNPIEYL